LEQAPDLLLCNLDCRPDLEADMGRLAQKLRDSGLFHQVLVAGALCRNHLKDLSCLKGKKILFGGCSLLTGGDFYDRAARALLLERGDYQDVDVMEILERYGAGPGLEQNLYARLLASARILERAQSVPEETLAAPPRALVYGSGLSGLQAASKLAAAGTPVDLVPTPDGPLSPGCLTLLLRDRGPQELLRARVRKQKNVTVLAAGEELLLRGISAGFRLDGGREYGSVVFAPERVEEDPLEPGSLNLTQLYARLEKREKITGTCVILFDHDCRTAPEIYRDGLEAALSVRSAGRARVWVLTRDVQVSFSGLETLYSACREAGVLFLKYREPPAVENVYGDFVLTGTDVQSGRRFRLPHPELMVIPRPARLPEAALRFAALLNLRLYRDSYAQPDSLWRLARDTSRPGVFACGAARGHMDADEVERDAEALVRALQRRLQPQGIAVEEQLAVVDGEKCAFCLTCVRACPSGAMGRDVEQRCAVVDPGSCRACGVCAAVCPAQAVQLRNLGSEALSAALEALA
jgi:ferredoxin